MHVMHNDNDDEQEHVGGTEAAQRIEGVALVTGIDMYESERITAYV